MTPGLAAGLAAGLIGGIPPLVLGIIALAWSAPLPALVLLTGAAVIGARGRSAEPSSEAARIVALASELRGGATLRSALGTLSTPLARLALAGRPVEELVAAIEEALPRHGQMVGAVALLADRLGGSVAVMFEELAVAALEVDELAREVRVATAPAYVQGAIVGGIPVLALVRLVASGGLGALAASGPAGSAVAVAGVGLISLGVVTVAVLVRRSIR